MTTPIKRLIASIFALALGPSLVLGQTIAPHGDLPFHMTAPMFQTSSGQAPTTPVTSPVTPTPVTPVGGGGSTGTGYLLVMPGNRFNFLYWYSGVPNCNWSVTGSTGILASGTHGAGSGSYLDSGLTNGTSYSYVGSFVEFDASGLNVIQAVTLAGAGTPAASKATFNPTTMSENLAHKLTVSLEVKGAQPVVMSPQTYASAFQYQGYVNYYLATDSSLVDPIVGSDQTGGLSKSFTLNGVQMNGLEVMSNDSQMQMTVGSGSGGPAHVYLVQETHWEVYNYDSNNNKQIVAQVTVPVKVAEQDYNVIKLNADAISIDSRKTYGQPNTDGTYPGVDPNADARNVNFSGWVYKGGLFAGFAPIGTGDLSGTARIQLYLAATGLSSPPTTEQAYIAAAIPATTELLDTVLTMLYMAPSTVFPSDTTLAVSYPSLNDPNLLVPMSSALWSNAWDLPSATSQATLAFNSSTAQKDYVNFQIPQAFPQMIVSLSNEASVVTGSTGYWQYFASPSYASSSGLFTATDARPRVWLLDRTLKTVAP